MPKPSFQLFRRYLLTWVVALCGLVAAILIVSTWDMNFWPTDAEDYYIQAAVKLPAMDYVSSMHETVDRFRSRLLHGKEVFIINAALFQRLLNDYISLRPLVFVCIMAVAFSALFIFLLARRFWGKNIGLICFAVYLTSFWSYLYILFVKHQPLGLFYFLLSVIFLLPIGKAKIPSGILFAASGLTLCLSIFSSTVSVLYLPYYLAAFLYFIVCLPGDAARAGQFVSRFLTAAAFSLAGFLAMFVYLTYPDMIGNVRGFIDYTTISKSFSHFYYNQPVLIQWIAHPELSVRGGWEWVVKYFLVIMPVLFPFYLACLAYLLCRFLVVKDNARLFRLKFFAIVILSVSSVFLAEWRGVAQYGANYFTSLVGIILLVGFTLNDIQTSSWFRRLARARKRGVLFLGGIVLAVHTGVNVFIYVDDIYPSRMATTFISEKINKLGVGEISSYMTHPCRLNIIDCLSPSLLSRVQFLGIANVFQANRGYILVPPAAGNSIYIDSTRNTYGNFDKDLYFNALIKTGKIKDYAVASFKTLSSSRIWLHEEEILSYRDLILGHDMLPDPSLGRAWLLDAEKLHSEFKNNPPIPEDVELAYNAIRNIGTRTMRYIYEGERKQVVKPTILKSFVMRMYKIGDPRDQLRAYLFRPGDEEPVWLKYTDNFASDLLEGQSLSADPQGASVTFHFTKPLVLRPGPYRIVIYRTGPGDDKNFYRVYTNSSEEMQAALEAAKILVP